MIVEISCTRPESPRSPLHDANQRRIEAPSACTLLRSGSKERHVIPNGVAVGTLGVLRRERAWNERRTDTKREKSGVYGLLWVNVNGISG
jgi:hypothetical protein